MPASSKIITHVGPRGCLKAHGRHVAALLHFKHLPPVPPAIQVPESAHKSMSASAHGCMHDSQPHTMNPFAKPGIVLMININMLADIGVDV
eukprot:1159028-Pelagomonas_calceolata.AAC.1